MTDARRGWTIIATLCVSLMLVNGPIFVLLGVLFPPLMKEFHWSHAQVASIASMSAFSVAVIAPLVGYLVDRFGARPVIALGLLIVGLAYNLVSHAHSLTAMIVLFTLAGIGNSFSGIIPLMVVALNWFKERKASAGGIAWAGAGVGMTLAPPVVTFMIAHWGWRVALQCMSLPAFLIALPAVLLMVHTRPGEGRTRYRRHADVLTQPGLEVRQALRTNTFWLLAAMQLCYAVAFGLVFVHQITFLIGVGYTPRHAALIFSLQTLISTPGVALMGVVSDRFGARVILFMNQFLHAIAVAALLGTASARFDIAMIVVFATFWGLSSGASGTLLPILVAETLGLRRVGTLSGMIISGSAVSAALGPFLSGFLYDLTGNYNLSFGIAIALFLVGGVLLAFVRPAMGRDEIPEPVALEQVKEGA